MDLTLCSSLLTLALTFSSIKIFFIGIVGFVSAFALAVFIHELGHFLAAKLFHVPVERFVIGFDKEAMGFLPRCIWEKKMGETVYGISLIPLGGYVKMSGVVHPDIEKYLDGDGDKEVKDEKAPVQNDQAVAETDDTTPSLQDQAMGDMAALYQKPFWQKTIIYGAGVAMNMILAIAVMGTMFFIGYEENAPYEARVGWMTPDNQFAQEGSPLVPGHYIISINDTKISTTSDISLAINDIVGEEVSEEALESLDLNIVLSPNKTAEGAEPTETYNYTVTFSNDEKGWGDFGDAFIYQEAYIDFVLPNTPADRADLERGDMVLAIDDTPIVDWSHFRYIVTNSVDQELQLLVERDGQPLTIPLTPWANADDPEKGQVGVLAGNPEKLIIRESFTVAYGNAPGRIYNMTKNYLSRLGELGKKLGSGNVTAVRREMGGPVGIGQIAIKMSQHGLQQWMKFVIMLNVALAVMNILPFPVLDGGHIIFASYEAVFKKPVPPKVLVPLLNTAVVFIMILFVLITINDVGKIVYGFFQ
jgi:regulator of sigma E protease